MSGTNSNDSEANSVAEITEAVSKANFSEIIEIRQLLGKINNNIQQEQWKLFEELAKKLFDHLSYKPARRNDNEYFLLANAILSGCSQPYLSTLNQDSEKLKVLNRLLEHANNDDLLAFNSFFPITNLGMDKAYSIVAKLPTSKAVEIILDLPLVSAASMYVKSSPELQKALQTNGLIEKLAVNPEANSVLLKEVRNRGRSRPVISSAEGKTVSFWKKAKPTQTEVDKNPDPDSLQQNKPSTKPKKNH